MPKFLYPKSHEEWLQIRTGYLTSTEMAALYGLSPYASHFELWHQKKGNIARDFEANERTRWGQLLERTIALSVGERYGVKVRALNAHVVHDECQMSSSFDFEVVGFAEQDEIDDDVLRELYTLHGPGILEIKLVDKFIAMDQWTAPKKDQHPEAPPHIEIQLQHQMECIDRKWGAIAALVGGNELWLLPRERDLDVGQAFRTAAGEFWDSQLSNQPPEPNYARDAEAIRQLFSYAEPGTLADLRNRADLESIAADYKRGGQLEKEGAEIKAAARSKLLYEIGDAEKALLPGGYKVSAGVRGEIEVAASTRKAYRDFRISGGPK